MKKCAVVLLCLCMLLCGGCLDSIMQIEEMQHAKGSEEKTGLNLDFWNDTKETVSTTVATVPKTTLPETTAPETTAPATEVTAPVLEETIPTVTLPVETVPVQTVPVTTEYTGSTSYKLHIDKNQAIYSGPGYSYSYVGAVEASTNYTIVGESYDSSGRLWGKLKSGVGWVDLSDIRGGGGYSTATSYVVKISDASYPIYSGPGYSYSYVGTVKKAGSYTIVQESYDLFGNLWGKLKSGVGWVCLTDNW